MRGALLLVGAIMLVGAVHPLFGRAEPPAENGNDYREIRPSPGAAVENTSPGAQGSDSPTPGTTSATGTISGLRGTDNPEMELRLRPQANGFLQGELVIHKPGFGLTPIEGFMRGDRLQFQVPYGAETYYFEGARRSDQISGTFESSPSGERSTWTAPDKLAASVEARNPHQPAAAPAGRLSRKNNGRGKKEPGFFASL